MLLFNLLICMHLTQGNSFYNVVFIHKLLYHCRGLKHKRYISYNHVTTIFTTHYKKIGLLWRLFCSGCENYHYMPHIVVLFWLAAVDDIATFHWTAAIDLAFCGILQRRYISRCNIRVLVALDIAIVVLHKLAAINIPFHGILQRRYIKPSQYISFSSIFVTYSSGLDDRRNRYFFAARLVQCIPLLLWPKCHFGFSLPSSLYFPLYPFVVSSKKKPTHFLPLFLHKHFHHQSFTIGHH